MVFNRGDSWNRKITFIKGDWWNKWPLLGGETDQIKNINYNNEYSYEKNSYKVMNVMSKSCFRTLLKLFSAVTSEWDWNTLCSGTTCATTVTNCAGRQHKPQNILKQAKCS